MTIILALLSRFWPYILGAVVLAGGYYFVEYRWCNHRCVAQSSRADAAEKLLADAKKRAADLALLWAAQVDKTEAKNREADAERRKTFDALADRARHLPARPPVPLSSDLDRLWRDASREANAARPAAERQ